MALRASVPRPRHAPPANLAVDALGGPFVLRLMYDATQSGRRMAAVCFGGEARRLLS